MFSFTQDKIQTFWDITKRELDSCRAELRNKDREIEDLQDRHQVEIKVVHLCCEFFIAFLCCHHTCTFTHS